MNKYIFFKLQIFCVFVLSHCFINSALAQCGCDDCDIYIADERDTIFQPVFVNNLANNELGITNQLKAVNIHFTHRIIDDLRMAIIAPNGQRVELIGRQNQASSSRRIFNTNFDLSFIPCSDPASPPAGYPDQWDNQSQDFDSHTDYEGSYHPYRGCLEDLTGPANGKWQLMIHDRFEQDSGLLYAFSLEFEDMTPANGESIYCAANECNMFGVPNIPNDTVCPNANMTIRFDTLNNVNDVAWQTEDGGILSSAASGEVRIQGSGTYTYVLVDPTTTCTDTFNLRIEEFNLPDNLTESSTDIISCDNVTATLQGPSGLGSEYSFVWKDLLGRVVGDERELQIDEAGDYTLEITNSTNGCMVSSTHTADEDLGKPDTPDLDTIRLKNCIEDYILSVKNLQDPDIRSVRWLVNGNQFDTDTLESSSDEISVALIGNNGCVSDFENHTLSPDVEPPTFTVEVFGNQELGCNISEVEIRANANNPKDFLWTGPANFSSNSLFADVSLPGTYTATVTGQNNCEASQQLEVRSNPNIPSVAISRIEKLDCDTARLAVNVTGPTTDYTWEWQDENGNVLSDELFVKVTENGVYSFIMRDPECTIQRDTFININKDKPNIIVPATASINCSNKDTGIRLNALSSTGTLGTAGLGFEWYDEAGFLLGTSGILTVNQPGEYTLIVEDLRNRCTSTTTVEVTSSTDLPEFDLENINPLDTLSCRKPEIQANITGLTVNGAPIVWRDGFGNTLSEASTFTVTEAGNYTVRVTNPTTTCSFERDFAVRDIRDYPRIVFQNNFDPISCNVTETELSAIRSLHSEDATYQWNGPGIISDASEKTVLVNAPGIYTLEITNEYNGCTDLDSLEVESQLEIPDVDAVKSGNIDCKDEEVRLSGSQQIIGANLRYQWSGPNGYQSFSFNSIVDEPGVYTLTVRNLESGCERSSDIEVEQITNTISGFNLDIKRPTCFNGQDAAININSVNGGTEPFTFILDNKDTLTHIAFDSLIRGTYNLKVIDKGYCEFSRAVVIDQAPLFSLEINGDSAVVLGEEVSLMYTSNKELNNIRWNSRDFQEECFPCETQTWLPTQSQSVQVTATDTDGCQQTAFFLLEVDTDNDDIGIQNAIYINSTDPKNKAWTVYPGPSIKEVHRAVVYNRWGVEIYSTDEVGMGAELDVWSNAAIKDAGINPGLLLYQLEVEYIDGRRKFIAGDLYLF